MLCSSRDLVRNGQSHIKIKTTTKQKEDKTDIINVAWPKKFRERSLNRRDSPEAVQWELASEQLARSGYWVATAGAL